jgi:hypothetical protein
VKRIRTAAHVPFVLRSDNPRLLAQAGKFSTAQLIELFVQRTYLTENLLFWQIGVIES